LARRDVCHRIVVSDGDRITTVLVSHAHKLVSRQKSVGSAGVVVQIKI
jgi:hypothetical protein